MSYSGSIKMPGELYKEIQKKYEKPATGIPLQDLSFLVTAEINKKAEIDDTAGVGDTDKTYSANKLAADHSSLLNVINVLKPAATASDVGKALVVKTVADGVPTAFEYGESGGGGQTDIGLSVVDGKICVTFEEVSA